MSFTIFVLSVGLCFCFGLFWVCCGLWVAAGVYIEFGSTMLLGGFVYGVSCCLSQVCNGFLVFSAVDG